MPRIFSICMVQFGDGKPVDMKTDCSTGKDTTLVKLKINFSVGIHLEK